MLAALIGFIWKLVEADGQRPDGRVLPDYGAAPNGLAIFTADGHHMLEANLVA